MRLHHHGMHAVLASAAVVLLIGGISRSAHYVQATANPDTTVIAVIDITQQGHCTLGQGNTSAAAAANQHPCPAGSVIMASFMPLSAAQAHHYLYVVPGPDNAVTAQEVATTRQSLRSSLLHATVIPNSVCPTGGPYYTNMYWGPGNGSPSFRDEIRFYVHLNGNRCLLNNTSDHIQRNGNPIWYWNYAVLDQQPQGRFCDAIPVNTFLKWYGPFSDQLYNTLYTADIKDGSNCTVFDDEITDSLYIN